MSQDSWNTKLRNVEDASPIQARESKCDKLMGSKDTEESSLLQKACIKTEQDEQGDPNHHNIRGQISLQWGALSNAERLLGVLLGLIECVIGFVCIVIPYMISYSNPDNTFWWMIACWSVYLCGPPALAAVAIAATGNSSIHRIIHRNRGKHVSSLFPSAFGWV